MVSLPDTGPEGSDPISFACCEQPESNPGRDLTKNCEKARPLEKL